MQVCRCLWPLLLAICVIPGCGPKSVTGGTKGTLKSGENPLSDMQVTVHQLDGGTFTPIGFAVTAADGSFELVTNGAQGPLVLGPGQYRFTLESVGTPVEVPEEFHQLESTPLKVDWTSGAKLEFDVPILTSE